jgi:hypothetical protein
VDAGGGRVEVIAGQQSVRQWDHLIGANAGTDSDEDGQ